MKESLKRLKILGGLSITRSSTFILEIESFFDEGLLEMTEWISLQSSLGLLFRSEIAALWYIFFDKFLKGVSLLACNL